MPVRNPRTGQDDYLIHPLDAAQLAGLAGRLRQAQPAWAAAGVAHRAQVLRQWVGLLAADPAPVVDALSIDTGRYRLAASEMQSLRGLVEGYAGMASALLAPAAERASVVPGIGIDTGLVPYQLVGVISPWNFPFLISMLDAIPALMAGCAVIVKPSEVTPRFIAPLMESVRRVPELAGVLAVIEGDGASGAALIEQVDIICFTGSVATGRKVGEACAKNFIPSCLELGGKDPAIVLASADPAQAARVVLRASVQATGQACQSLERVYVQRPIYEPFMAALTAAARGTELNYPDMHAGQVGPLIFARQAAIIEAQLAEARARGARVLTGGEIEHHGGGSWLRPTVVADVSPDMQLMSEETFGPVVPVMPFDDIDEAVRLANDSRYGLSAAVFGAEAEARAVAARLDAGAISINDGGLTTEAFDAEKNSFKLSGMGPSRMGSSGLMRFLRKRAILIQRGRAKVMEDLDERGGRPAN
ncbi:MAG: aldehyde dehydrogenase family protein [Gammaproteobacteria bacterium]|nr:aldehyde dehydrogenase family protein [Gammaproteobacteria bacterium]